MPEARGDLLTLTGVGRFFGEKPVLKKIDCAVSPGETLLIVGVNGAGKSTLLSLMAGLSRPSAGRVETSLSPGEIGFLGHKTFLYPELTARENLCFWAGAYGRTLSREAGDAALERVGLLRAADERAGVFSRGMSQRLNLARVFLQRPRLLLLDEPGSGLDARSADMLRREIRAAGEGGAGVVLVSHDLAADLSLADTILFLENRRAAYHGPAAAFALARLTGEGA